MDYQIVAAYMVAIVVHIGLMIFMVWLMGVILDNTLGRFLTWKWRRDRARKHLNSTPRDTARETDAEMHQRLKRYASE